jgi:hypothetical protein
VNDLLASDTMAVLDSLQTFSISFLFSAGEANNATAVLVLAVSTNCAG